VKARIAKHMGDRENAFLLTDRGERAKKERKKKKTEENVMEISIFRKTDWRWQ
jgi:hypothetical protein